MFKSNHYLLINREERFYCFLFAHALLASPAYRKRIVSLVASRFGVMLDVSALEVYVEVAALRDYWNDLGDSKEYSRITHERRLAVLHAIMDLVSVDPKVIDEHTFFWTGQPGSKLWSPGRWDVRSIEDAGLGQLKRIRWAFNAKPDILLRTPAAGLVIEAKVESGEGRQVEIGYEQIETQRLIINLWKHLIPGFDGIDSEPAMLTLTKQARGLTWEDVTPVESDTELDEFTRRGLAGLRRYNVDGVV